MRRETKQMTEARWAWTGRHAPEPMPACCVGAERSASRSAYVLATIGRCAIPLPGCATQRAPRISLGKCRPGLIAGTNKQRKLLAKISASSDHQQRREPPLHRIASHRIASVYIRSLHLPPPAAVMERKRQQPQPPQPAFVVYVRVPQPRDGFVDPQPVCAPPRPVRRSHTCTERGRETGCKWLTDGQVHWNLDWDESLWKVLSHAAKAEIDCGFALSPWTGLADG